MAAVHAGYASQAQCGLGQMLSSKCQALANGDRSGLMADSQDE